MEYPPSPENSSTDLKKAIQGLIRGRELTLRLKEIMKKAFEGGVTTIMAEDLVGKIMDSFSETISVINSGGFDESKVVVGSPSSEKPPEDYSSGSCKSSSIKDRRGCYKRRRTSETNIKETATLVDDGHAWRKYGQKQILHSTYPRHYYRCTHKFDQQCQATKHVQKIQDNPPLFRTAYHGHHTCKPNFPRMSEIILDTQIHGDSNSVLLSFDRNISINHSYQYPYSSLPTFSSLKQENKDEVFTNSDYSQPPHDHLTPATFEVSGAHMAAALSPDVISSGGVYSSCTTTDTTHDNLEIDFEEYLWNFE